MGEVTLRSNFADEVILVKLAREIAMDIGDLETILKNYSISQDQWENIQSLPRFGELLKQSVIEWQSAINTESRIKLKAAASLEMWLEEAHKRLHDNNENLNAKVELAKFLGRLAGMGIGGATITDPGEKLTITINLGADQQIKLQHELPPKVIDHEPPPTQEQ